MNISLMLIWQWCYCDDASYEGFANFYIQQAKEERFHGKKSMIISTIVVNINLNQYHSKTEFKSILETFKDGLAQEQDVTRRFTIYLK